jgi:hypothetical protein
MPRSQLAEGERPGENEGAAREPETQSKTRRGQGADQLGRRQEDADADRVTDDEGRRRPETERAGVVSGRGVHVSVSS